MTSTNVSDVSTESSRHPQTSKVGRPRSLSKRAEAIRFFANVGRLPEYDPPQGHRDYGMVKKAAVAANVDQKSIRNWLRDSEFRDQVQVEIDISH